MSEFKFDDYLDIEKFFNLIENNQMHYYALSLICYRYISEQVENYLSQFFNGDLNISNMEDFQKYHNNLKNLELEKFGFYLSDSYLFGNIYKKSKNNDLNLKELDFALKTINESTKMGYNGIFKFFDLSNYEKEYSSKFINSFYDLINVIGDVDFEELGEKGFGEFFDYFLNIDLNSKQIKYNRDENVNMIFKFIVKIFEYDYQELSNLFFFDSYSGHLFLKLVNELNINKYYGSVNDSIDMSIVKMNMIVHNVDVNNFKFIYNENISQDNLICENMISTPPIGYFLEWLHDFKVETLKNFDESCKYRNMREIFNLTDKLNEDGLLVVLTYAKNLHVGGSEKKFRKKLLDLNLIDTVITLPLSTVYGDDLVLLVLKKSKKDDNIFFIYTPDILYKSTKEYGSAKNGINKVLEIYDKRQFCKKISSYATKEDIIKNNFNLNISRYVDTFNEKIWLIPEVLKDINKNNKELLEIDKMIKESSYKLGLNLK